jgi:hypothetical protein
MGLRGRPELSARLTCQELSSSLLVQLALPYGLPRFRVAPAGSIDSARSKQRASIFCVRYSVRSFLAPSNNFKMSITRYTNVVDLRIAKLMVITLFRAAMVGALTEDHLRCLLTESGEMRRWKEAEHETPEGFEVLYPPPPLDADALIRLAEPASRLEQLDDVSSLEES